MTLNLSARNHQVLIYNAEGVDPLDVSDVVMDLSTSDRQLDQSGLIPTNGTLTLHGYAGLGESMDARTNATRWARGNKVELWISNSTGILTRHPRGAMRILKEPSPPHLGNRTMQLDLGCVLSLLDYRQPPDDQSGVELGTATPRTTIINNLLSAAGAPPLIDTVPGTLDVPLFRFEGSYIQQAGAIAYAAGYVLWVDNQERVRATQINLKPPTAFLSLVAGESELEYTPLRDAETPCEVIRVTGVGYVAKVNEEPDNEYSISRASLSTVFSTADDTEETIETNATRYRGTTTSSPLIEQTRQQLLGLLMPERYPNNRSLVIGDRNTTEPFFEGGSSKRLKKKVQTTYGLKGAVLPDYYAGDRTPMPSKRVVIKPEYAGESVRQLTTSTYEPFALVNPNLYLGSGNSPRPAPETLTLSQVVTQTWKQYSDGWTSTTTTTNYKKGSKGGATASVSGTSTNPPAPERQQEAITREEKQLVGEANFIPRAGAAFSEREREYQVAPGTVTTEAELERIARQIGAILIGRSQGVEWVSDLPDAWLTDYEPIKRVDWQEDNTTFAYLANGVSFALGDRSCVVGADGIWIGTQMGTNPVPTPPYNLKEVIQISSRSSLEVKELPYELNTGTEIIDFAQTFNFEVKSDLERINFSATNGFAVLEPGGIGGAGGNGAEYSGNGETRTISVDLEGEATDWVMIFDRTDGNTAIFDSVRGVGRFTRFTGSQEQTEADSLTAFNVDGFDLGANLGGFPGVNLTGNNYMAWTLARNEKFDVVTWQGDGVAGRAIAHNLGATPSVILIANLSQNLSWTIYHNALGNAAALEFPGGNAIAGQWNTTNPTSTHFVVSDSERVNGLDFLEEGYQYVAYLWATEAGSYIGNGADPGVLQVSGTTPERLWIIAPRYDGENYQSEMTLFDSVRNPANPRDKAAWIGDSNSGGEVIGSAALDFENTGFIPNGDGRVNSNGQIYYYWYF